MGQSFIERLKERRRLLEGGDATGGVEARNTEAIQEELGTAEELADKTGEDDNKQ